MQSSWLQPHIMPSCIGPLRMQKTTALFIAWASKSMDMLSHWFLDLACGHFRTKIQVGARRLKEWLQTTVCDLLVDGEEWLAEYECRTKGSPKYDSILHYINRSLSRHPLCLGLCAGCIAPPTHPPTQKKTRPSQQLGPVKLHDTRWCWGTTPLGTSSGCSLLVMLLATCFRPESLRSNTAVFNEQLMLKWATKPFHPTNLKGQSSENLIRTQ